MLTTVASSALQGPPSPAAIGNAYQESAKIAERVSLYSTFDTHFVLTGPGHHCKHSLHQHHQFDDHKLHHSHNHYNSSTIDRHGHPGSGQHDQQRQCLDFGFFSQQRFHPGSNLDCSQYHPPSSHGCSAFTTSDLEQFHRCLCHANDYFHYQHHDPCRHDQQSWLQRLQSHRLRSQRSRLQGLGWSR